MKASRAVLFVIVALSCLSCGDNVWGNLDNPHDSANGGSPATDSGIVTGVSLSSSTLTIGMGATQQLTATVTPRNATNSALSWKSSNSSVATVSTSGLVAGAAIGTATITVTTSDGGYAATCAVTVVVPVAVTGITISQSSLTIAIGGTAQLNTVIAPSGATDTSVAWTSSDTTVAAVSPTGLVSAIKVGTATVTVKTADGGFTASCVVTVNPVSVTGVSLNPSSASVAIGKTQQLTAALVPANATNTALTWSSSAGAVATVSSAGLVTGVASGTAIITVTTADGGFTATSTITVTTTVAVTGVSLETTSVGLLTGKTLQLTATMSPGAATNKTVTWSSSNSSVASVSTSGLVTGVAVGSATITVTTADGGYTASCLVSVTVGPVSVTSVSLSPIPPSYLEVGQTYQLAAAIYPSNATNQSVTWTSSNTAIATVSSTGLVTGIALGSAMITVTTNDGYYTTSCSLTVDNFPFTATTMSTSFSIAAMSSDGTKLAGVSSTGAMGNTIWTSSDGGKTWTQQTGSGSRSWGGIVMSGDGTKIAAYVSNGYIFCSSDGGVTWNTLTGAGSRSWSSIAMSSDGSTIAACVNPGYILTSHDSGTTWTVQTGAGSNTWGSIALSSNGTKMVAGISASAGNIFISTDGGVTWAACSGAGSGYWYNVTMSGDGSVIAAYNGSKLGMYISRDSGSTWTSLTPPSGYYFSSTFVSSSDGSVMASYNGNSFLLSKNYGATWSGATRNLMGNGNLLMSSDGSKIVFFNGNIMYTYNGN